MFAESNQFAAFQESRIVYGKEMHIGENQRLIIDDFTNIPGMPNCADLAQAYAEIPGVNMVSAIDLNRELIELLQAREWEQISRGITTNKLYIGPGTGAQRMVASLQALGYPIENFINVQTSRDKSDKSKTIISEDSKKELDTALKTGAYTEVVILDDAINGGGTVEELCRAIRSGDESTDADIVAAVQIRFVTDDSCDGTFVKGIKGTEVISSRTIYGPNRHESAPTHYLSSVAKREYEDDKRNLEMAGGNEQILATLNALGKEVRKRFLKTVAWKDREVVLQSGPVQQAAEMFSMLTDRRVVIEFLNALFTLGELEDMGKRLEAAKLLWGGIPPQDVVNKSGLSLETVMRILAFVRYDVGYHNSFSRRDEMTSQNSNSAQIEYMI